MRVRVPGHPRVMPCPRRAEHALVSVSQAFCLSGCLSLMLPVCGAKLGELSSTLSHDTSACAPVPLILISPSGRAPRCRRQCSAEKRRARGRDTRRSACKKDKAIARTRGCGHQGKQERKARHARARENSRGKDAGSGGSSYTGPSCRRRPLPRDTRQGTQRQGGRGEDEPARLCLP